EEDGTGRQLPAGLHERDAMRVAENGPVADDLATGALDRGNVGRFQPRDLAVLVGNERGPVEARVDGPAEALGEPEHVVEAAGVNEKLLGDAAPDHAGAADPEFFDHRDPGAIAGCKTRRLDAA